MARTKKMRWLVGVAVISLLIPFFSVTALAHGGREEAVLITGGYQVSLVFPDHAKAGENLLTVKILDGMGLPVSGARVEISATPVENKQHHLASMDSSADVTEGMEGMHEMQGMEGMHGTSRMGSTPAALTANDTEGDYVGLITFPSTGHWRLNTHLTIDGQMLMADFPVEVEAGSSAFAMTVLTAFAGLNAAIIWIASLTKRNPVSA